MPRRPNPTPSVILTTALPGEVHARMTLHLYSELEGRVPQGAYREFLSELIREFFDHRLFDLAPFAATDPGRYLVRAHPETLRVLELTLKGELP